MKSPFNLAFTASFFNPPSPPDADASSVDQLLGHDYLKPIKELQHKRLLEGKPVVDLSMVNPDLPPPRPVIDRLLESVTKTSTHRYSVSRGVRRLREGFAEKYASRFGVSLDPESEVCVCLGSKDATFHALRVLIHPGDSVLVAAPSYPAHLSAVTLVGGWASPWQYSTDPHEAARSLAQEFERTKARVLLLNFPSNPAGAVVSAQWWSEVGAVCAKYGATIVNDFVYGEMCFGGGAAVSALSARAQGASVVEVYSLSKAYNVPGWRVGALVGDARLVKAVSRLKAHADYGLFLPLQYAAAVALTAKEDLVRPTVSAYERRVRVLVHGLTRLGWDVTEPQAGACVWARVPLSLQAMAKEEGAASPSQVAEFLLDRTGVLVAPGRVFGEGFDDFVRFAAVVSEERIREVVSSLTSLAHANSL